VTEPTSPPGAQPDTPETLAEAVDAVEAGAGAETFPSQHAPTDLPLEEGVANEVEPVSTSSVLRKRGVELRGRTMRQHAGHGTIVNTIYMIGLSVLGLVRGFVLAAFLSRADYGVWGTLAVSLGTVLWLKQVGIGDKFIQQDEDDQVNAFQKAFTLELMFTSIFMGIIAILVPIYALAIYHEPKLLAPGFVLVALLPAGSLQAPIWIFYRRLNYTRQRLFQAIEPVVGFVVCLVLAISGAGYWALAGGVLSGAWTAAIVVMFNSPYPLRLRFDRQTLRSYFSFSWPLFIGNGSSLVIAQSAVIAAESRLGLAGVGAITLGSSINSFVTRVDSLVTGTLYPMICIVKDRLKLLEETFIKSNRLALMWAIPFGTSIALFIGDLVHFVISNKWDPAIGLLQITGFNAAFGHIAYNWDAYMRATNRTRPIMVASIASMVAFVAIGLPLLYKYGLKGLALGIVAQTVANVICRAYYLRQLFNGFSYLRHALRAVLPNIFPLAAIIVVRELESGPRTLHEAVLELAAYIAMTAILTWVFERDLLREAMGYVRRRQARQAAAAAT
jgi:O-antigen/teichoic acid export membrane protein